VGKHCPVTGRPLLGRNACDCGACDDLTEGFGGDEDNGRDNDG